MDTPAVLLRALQLLCESIDDEAISLTEPLTDLGRELQAGVHDYVGVEVTVLTDLDLPVTLTEFVHDLQVRVIRTSLRLPLGALTSAAPGHITFYGGRSGSFVDLAADLGFVLGPTWGDEAGPPVDLRLDQDLRPIGSRSGLIGATEASTVHRAIGVLIGRGRTPDEAETELLCGARRVHLTLAAFAGQTLQLAQPGV